MVRTFKLKPWVYAGLLALSPLSADAAGLGKLSVTSALGQPLRGEIELLAVQKAELDSIVARLASPEAYREAKIERAGSVVGIKFTVGQRKDGTPVLKVTTVQPVNEPFLDLLVELNWASGRLLREYTILLDPPGYKEPQPMQPVAAPTVQTAAAPVEATPLPEPIATPVEPAATPAEPAPAPEAKAEEPKPKTEPAPSAEKEAPAPAAAPARPSPAPGSYAVKKGDTLTAIANEVKPEGYSLEQMLVALYEANHQAFSGKNMNRLKAGQILRIPDEHQIASVDRAEASREVKTHTTDWQAYRQKLAGAVAEAPAPTEEAAKQEAKGKISAAVQDQAAPPAEPSKDVLKVSKGEGAGGKDAKALQGRIQSLQEEAVAREKTLKDANERIAALEKNVKEMQQLVELKNKSLADLQKQAAAKPEAPAVTPAPPKPTEPVAEKAPEPAPTAAPQPAPVPPPAEEKPPMPKPKPAVVPKPKPAPSRPAPGLMDAIMDNPLYLAGGAGALLLAGGGALVAINRRRRKNLASFEDSILTGGDLKANTVFGETAGGVVDTGNTSFLTDFSQAGLGTIDTNDVDPIAEAEVYMAYGRDAQAEEILKEAMTKDPNRHEIHLKLLEIYAARKNLIAFETLAGELYAAIGGKASPVWDKAAEMGRALDPNNPLYGEKEEGAKPLAETAIAAGAGMALGEPTLGFGGAPAGLQELPGGLEIEEEAPAPTAAPATRAAPAAPPPPTEESAALEFDLGPPTEAHPPPAPQAATPAPAEPDHALDFDLGEFTLSPQAPAPQAPKAAEETKAALETTGALGLDFDLDTVMPPVAETPPAAPAAQPGELTLELPEATAAAEEPIEIKAAPAPAEPHLDFDFDLGIEPTPATAAKAKEAMPELDLSGVSLDLGGPTIPVAEAASPAEGGAASQEVATKLDLARAYVEMGDKEGAREILDEVLKEGNTQQKSDANQLLATL